MPRKLAHRLKRPKVRTDWSKWNLYNLSRLSVPPAANKTFFQQKWLAKSLARGYHAPHVREGTWTRMFDRRLPAVVPMDHQYLAQKDGSEFSAGRGSGRDEDPQKARTDRRDGRNVRDDSVAKTPYMHQTFHPLERRLDMAIWRALFASSAKQARQYVVHGFVKVNGKKMIYPGYLLNPGDMFSVEPDRVMFGTGDRKFSKESALGVQDREEQRRQAKESSKKEQEDQEEDDEDSEAGAATLESEDEREAMSKAPEEHEDAKKAIKSLMTRARRILDDSKRKLSGRRQQELRSFTQSLRKTLSKHGSKSAEDAPMDNTIENLEAALAQITSKIPADTIPQPPSSEAELGSAEAAAAADAQANLASSNPQMQDSSKTDEYRARKDAELLHAALERARENPVDVRKPYATPWKPREFMSAFAFIPRYLEVNQNICSAVYLRHPVARPGLAEVPTPFHGETMGLAFNWYLRRR